MKIDIDFVLVVLALICFALATLNVKAPVNLIALGLFFYALTALL
jgi:hypothetical protein